MKLARVANALGALSTAENEPVMFVSDTEIYMAKYSALRISAAQHVDLAPP